ncbi:hypothetical protein PS2_033011 [Malus domestica]
MVSLFGLFRLIGSVQSGRPGTAGLFTGTTKILDGKHQFEDKDRVPRNIPGGNVTSCGKKNITFKSSVEFIEGFNKKSENKCRLDINKFADLTNEEFQATGQGYKRIHLPEIMYNSSKAAPDNNFRYENVTDVPKSKDYFSIGAVSL